MGAGESFALRRRAGPSAFGELRATESWRVGPVTLNFAALGQYTLEYTFEWEWWWIKLKNWLRSEDAAVLSLMTLPFGMYTQLARAPGAYLFLTAGGRAFSRSLGASHRVFRGLRLRPGEPVHFFRDQPGQWVTTQRSYAIDRAARSPGHGLRRSPLPDDEIVIVEFMARPTDIAEFIGFAWRLRRGIDVHQLPGYREIRMTVAEALRAL